MNIINYELIIEDIDATDNPISIWNKDEHKKVTYGVESDVWQVLGALHHYKAESTPSGQIVLEILYSIAPKIPEQVVNLAE